jgi:chemotaxis protein methyltransferase CheR
MADALDLSPEDRADYEAFKRSVERKCGVNLDRYKEQQMHRRILGLVHRAGQNTFQEYFRVLDSDSSEWAYFLDRMTINVSELFRNAEKWKELEEHILPELLKSRQTLRIWSAGCSIGAEPYTLAMILDSLTPGSRHMVLATDIDDKILEVARRGVFCAQAVREVPLAYRNRYLEEVDGGFRVKADLRSGVRFAKQNLLADEFDVDYDLIVCRNVVIYFTDSAKKELYGRFVRSLRSGGTLFVGGTERVCNSSELGLSSPLPFFYRRAA